MSHGATDGGATPPTDTSKKWFPASEGCWFGYEEGRAQWEGLTVFVLNSVSHQAAGIPADDFRNWLTYTGGGYFTGGINLNDVRSFRMDGPCISIDAFAKVRCANGSALSSLHLLWGWYGQVNEELHASQANADSWDDSGALTVATYTTSLGYESPAPGVIQPGIGMFYGISSDHGTVNTGELYVQMAMTFRRIYIPDYFG